MTTGSGTIDRLIASMSFTEKVGQLDRKSVV